MANAAKKPHGILVYSALLIFIPELWFSGLYFNTSIFAVPFVLFSALLIQTKSSFAYQLLAGILLGLAILIRIDFILVCPLLAVFAWSRTQLITSAMVLALAVITVLGIGLAFDLVKISQVIFDYNDATSELLSRAQEPGWDRKVKNWILTIIVYPFSWILIVAGLYDFLRHQWQGNTIKKVIYILAILPLLFRLPNLLSLKYILPFYIFLPVFFIHSYEYITDQLPLRFNKHLAPACLYFFALLALFVSVEPQKNFPYIKATMFEPKQLITHDGMRTFGAYLLEMYDMDRNVKPSLRELAGDELFAYMQKSNAASVLFVGVENYFDIGAIGWRHFQLLAERAGVHGEVIGNHLIAFNFGGRYLWLGTEREHNFSKIVNMYNIQPLVIDLTNPDLLDNQAYDFVHQAINN
jgi:hypothetical protein